MVSGNIEGLQADSMMILKLKEKNMEIVKIGVSKGVFTFKDTISEPYFIQILKLNRETGKTDGKLTEFLVEEGSITISGKSGNYRDIRITGSKADLVLKKYLAEDKRLQMTWDSLHTLYEGYLVRTDTVNRKLMAVELNKVTFDQRVPLLKKYVRDFNDSIIGALIPNFCTLKSVLKKEDYAEMYDLLSENMRRSNYGQSILEKTK